MTDKAAVKTLPANLPEPRPLVLGPRSTQNDPWATEIEPRVVAFGSRIGVNGAAGRIYSNFGVGLFAEQIVFVALSQLLETINKYLNAIV